MLSRLHEAEKKNETVVKEKQSLEKKLKIEINQAKVCSIMISILHTVNQLYNFRLWFVISSRNYYIENIVSDALLKSKV